MTDLLFGSRIVDAGDRAGVAVRIVAEPAALPPPHDVGLVIVDWTARTDVWAETLRTWLDAAGGRPPRLVLFGSHVDVAAHREARRHGLGPVMARSAFVTRVGELVAGGTELSAG